MLGQKQNSMDSWKIQLLVIIDSPSRLWERSGLCIMDYTKALPRRHHCCHRDKWLRKKTGWEKAGQPAAKDGAVSCLGVGR